MATTQILSGIIIRPMHLQDVDAVAKIENQVYYAPWPKLAFGACLEKGYQAYVMCHEEEIMGYTLVTVAVDEAHIINFVIAPQFQHQGLGRQLLTFLIAELAKQQIHHLSLEVRSDNQPAIQLYESFGFQRAGLRKQYYQTATGRMDALILVRK